jgi:mannose-6-phosphate isomerase-like protein (cupin superfamily)
MKFREHWVEFVDSSESILRRYTMAETKEYPYETRLNILYPPLEKALADGCTYQWYNQTLCQVNNSVVRLGVVQGQYHWHKHDDDDEFFYVLEGRLSIDLENRLPLLGMGKRMILF